MKKIVLLFSALMLSLSATQAFAQDPYLEDFTSTTGSDVALTGLPEGWDIIGSMSAYERRTESGQYHNGKPSVAANSNSSNYLVTPALEAGQISFYLRHYTKNYAISAFLYYCNEEGGTLTVGEQIGNEAYVAKGTPSWNQFTFVTDKASRLAILVKSGMLDDFLAVNGLHVGGTETGVEEIAVSTVNEGATYNLQGQRVSENTKGLVIKNGKKYFNK